MTISEKIQPFFRYQWLKNWEQQYLDEGGYELGPNDTREGVMMLVSYIFKDAVNWEKGTVDPECILNQLYLYSTLVPLNKEDLSELLACIDPEPATPLP